MRLATCSTAVLMSRQCSSKSTVGDSPVVPDDDDARRAVGDVEIDELAQGRQVERPALAHRRRDRDKATGQHRDAVLTKMGHFTVTADLQPRAGRPPSIGPDGGQPLDDGRSFLPLHQPLLEGDHRHRRGEARERQELVAAQEELGFRRPSVSFVAHRERLVEQDAVRCERGAQVREQRPVQIVGDHDGVERFAGERPGRAFEVEDPACARRGHRRGPRGHRHRDRPPARARRGMRRAVRAGRRPPRRRAPALRMERAARTARSMAKARAGDRASSTGLAPASSDLADSAPSHSMNADTSGWSAACVAGMA
jgi:hypothetical protein